MVAWMIGNVEWPSLCGCSNQFEGGMTHVVTLQLQYRISLNSNEAIREAVQAEIRVGEEKIMNGNELDMLPKAIQDYVL